ncbi:DHHA1 domain-containing protein [Janthinobacterium sp.]|uniref:DHHA1 domain-containing protein n=1 Tax=Janthinobacterium sp. TaxID=1871054 RepID=UPI00293D94B1|nr:DHHA1 domain-containing protein [Janthinobacterium sp.]
MKPAASGPDAGPRTLPEALPDAVFDVFNGDADGICALHQLRLAEPKRARLLTGVKRDIALLERLPAGAALDVTVLDISLDCNAAPLKRILDAGGRVAYFDHHSASLAFSHPRLDFFWDDDAQVCSSILVDRHLGGRFRAWAAVGAFGDNLDAAGRALAAQLGLAEAEVLALRELGSVLNYNAYGEQLADLHMEPEALYRAVQAYADPLAFIAGAPQYRALLEGYHADRARMAGLQPRWRTPGGAVFLLPAAPWARRVSGILANELIAARRALSCAVLSENRDGSYLVSVRSGEPAQLPACALCERFRGGGGRRAAAGITSLPAAQLEHFVAAFSAYFAAGAGGHAC